MVYAYADPIIAQICTEDMTLKEQVYAIYTWTRQNIGYSGDSEKGNWLQAAYEGFVTHTGDCYTYACIMQALLNSAGIDNVMIEKIPTKSTHYWNLVNIGEGWYHVDATPRTSKATFFYLTEEELMLYSDNHYNSHNYDRSLYPTAATYTGDKPLVYEDYYGSMTVASSDTDETDTAETTEATDAAATTDTTEN